jgi:xanthine/uracil permease
MTLFIILGCVFAAVALMVFFGERYGKPLDEKQQGSYSKIITGLVFFMILAALIKQVV